MAVLIMMQPDLGTTVALAIVFMAVLFFAGAPWWMFASLGGAGLAGVLLPGGVGQLPAGPAAVVHQPGGAPGRVATSCCRACTGWATAAGSASGSGQSRAKWSYLPNADSDFIFAIIGEELGLIGAGILVLLLFALLAYTGLRIARRNVGSVRQDRRVGGNGVAGRPGLRSTSGTSSVCCPVTGIPLPMISAGGTSLLITMVVFGLLANFARREPQAEIALHAAGGSRIAQFLGMRPAGPAVASRCSAVDGRPGPIVPRLPRPVDERPRRPPLRGPRARRPGPRPRAPDRSRRARDPLLGTRPTATGRPAEQPGRRSAPRPANPRTGGSSPRPNEGWGRAGRRGGP